MSRFRVVVTDQVFPDVDKERALIEEAGGSLDVAGGDRQQVLQQCQDADALLNTYFPFSAEDIAGLRRCRIIARYGIGVDNIDLAAAQAAGIAVTNVPDYCVEEVALHTVTLILALARRLGAADALVRSGGWGASKLGEVRRLSTLTVGLLGYGRIARQVAATLSPLTAGVLVHDPYVSEVGPGERLVDLETLAASADIVSVHCPLTPQTRDLVDAKFLATMKPGSMLVNTSRGPIVVLADVVAALESGGLAGAGLDVFPTEPPDAARLASVPNLLMSPHSAFYSREAIAESQRKATTQVLKALRGEPLDYPVG
jgi:D-3-phosphoglycerate dehydrogenase